MSGFAALSGGDRLYCFAALAGGDRLFLFRPSPTFI